MTAAHGLTPEAANNERLGSAYEAHIGERLTTPRAINRHVIQLDFAVLSFLRTFEPRLYAQLARMKGALATDRPRRHRRRGAVACGSPRRGGVAVGR